MICLFKGLMSFATFILFLPEGYTHQSFRIAAMTRGFNVNDTNPEILGGSHHHCYRKCTAGDVRTCYYSFTLVQYTSMSFVCGECPYIRTDCYKNGCISAGGYVRSVTVANHMLPGPSIQVCQGDTVRVDVINTFTSDSTTIHWHGIHQVDSPYMDGTPYLTQCPIAPHNSFQYQFVAQPAGTHIWHSHIGFEEADGLYSSLIVRKNDDPLAKYYDYDLADHVMIIWHWYHSSTAAILTAALHTSDSVSGYSFLINGLTADIEYTKDNITYTTPRAVFNVVQGQRYRFRVIYNNAVYCPVQVSIDNHTLLMIASESGTFEPVEVDSFMINGGERFDFVLSANQTPDNYWIRYRGVGDCETSLVTVSKEAILRYNGADNIEPSGTTTYEDANRAGVLFNAVQMSTNNYPNNTVIKVVDLNNTATNPANISGTPDYTFYLHFLFNTFNSFHSPGPYPQINNISFEYPSFPLLTQYEHITDDIYCTEDNDTAKECIGDYCTCPYLYPVSKNSLVEVVLVDLSLNRDQDHPMHLHGYEFYVVAMESVGVNISLDEIKRLNEAGLLDKKLYGAPVKDNIGVPSRGYTIIRFVASNPGYWFFHCHVTNHAEMGMGVVFKVGEHEEMIQPPKTFPRCGNWKLTASSSNGDRSLFKFFRYNVVIVLLLVFSLLD
ncbi:laccase-4 [Cephus cinctus]|uniref:Laccase-4 n=1 Tax=Cephus cinctus TaxID=211228 RepID=A0AAJ7FCA7_CEPCN|nr:laccase-4 [Cephus cinctus]XP_024935877.1 laccase-4 [Cephus cinctus]